MRWLAFFTLIASISSCETGWRDDIRQAENTVTIDGAEHPVSECLVFFLSSGAAYVNVQQHGIVRQSTGQVDPAQSRGFFFELQSVADVPGFHDPSDITAVRTRNYGGGGYVPLVEGSAEAGAVSVSLDGARIVVHGTLVLGADLSGTPFDPQHVVTIDYQGPYTVWTGS